MLNQETSFPYVGSYALFEDRDQPRPATELVRIIGRRNTRDGEETLVSFPLRDGASGNRAVPFAELIDATPLTNAEEREFHELDRLIAGRPPSDLSRSLRAKAKRRNALKARLIWSRFMAQKLRDLRAREQLRAA
jgi:hypothetical protein